jgi:hypothetical protein
MNYHDACVLLEVEDEVTIEILKRQYRRKALQYHPDKNKSVDAPEKFNNIKNAYEYLLKYLDNPIMDEDFINPFENIVKSEYTKILFSFLNNILGTDVQYQDIKSRLFYVIVNKIANCCENKACDLLEKIDKKLLMKISDFFFKYKDIFHFSDDFLKKLEDMIASNTKDDQCIILNPFLEDLFENNLYKLTENGNIYYIPLWHHELVYDNSGSDMYVKCIPILPEHISIDSHNNIHVELKYDIRELWGRSSFEIHLGKNVFSIFTENLKLKETQTIILENQGISIINLDNIFDISKKSNIVVYLQIDI